jgi:hypothetical protein
MEFNPPIIERTDKELLNIISNDELWGENLQIQAEKELEKRNYTKQNIFIEKQKRIDLIDKFRNRQKSRKDVNRKESYTFKEMILIIAFFPFSLLIKFNPLEEFWELDEGNFKRKIWQRIILILASLILWFLIANLFLR